MAQVKRNDIEQEGDPFPEYAATHHGYDAGGPIARLQADLALRLASEKIGQASAVPLPPAERWIRLASIASGYTALLAGYVVATLAVARWV